MLFSTKQIYFLQAQGVIRSLIYFFIPVSVFVFSWAFNEYVADSLRQDPINVRFLEQSIDCKKVAAQIYLSIALSFAVGFFCVVTSIYTIIALGNRFDLFRTGLSVTFFLLGSVPVLLLAVLLAHIAPGFHKSIYLAFQPVYDCVLTACSGGWKDLYLMNAEKLSLVIMPAAVLLAIGSSTVALRFPQDDGNEQGTIEDIRRKLRSLNIFLFLGTMILILSLLEMSAWNRLPIPFLEAKSGTDFREYLFNSHFFFGILFSACLACVYVPPAFRLEDEIRALAIFEITGIKKSTEATPSKRVVVTEEDISSWINKNGFSFGLTQRMWQVAAILAPVATGPIATVMTQLTRAG